jgi:hypothetical protein
MTATGAGTSRLEHIEYIRKLELSWVLPSETAPDAAAADGA